MWHNECASRPLHLVTVLRMLLVRHWQAVFMCLFLQCRRTPEWLVIPQLLQHSSDSSPQPPLFTGPCSNKSPHIVSPHHFRGCLYILIASIYNSEHPSPGLACGRLLWWLWTKCNAICFSAWLECSVRSGRLQCAAVANQDVFGQQCRAACAYFVLVFFSQLSY